MTCPLLLYGPHVVAGEAPVLAQDLPLPPAEVLGGQAPQNGAQVLGLQLVVLPEGQGPAVPWGLAPGHAVLGGHALCDRIIMNQSI